ncbi:MAG: peptidoglycan-binding domain-containing protein [Alphaproteobacteria bacterium]
MRATARGSVLRSATVAAAVLLFAGQAAAAPHAAPRPGTGPGGAILVQDARQLPPAQRAALVRAIQEELRAKGHDPGPVDGVFGGRTRNAIQAYQRRARLRVDGLPTKELLDHLRFATPQPAAEPPRRAGPPPPQAQQRAPQPQPARQAPAGRSLILDVQRELSVRGYYRSTLDGVSGPATQAAVRAFQRDAGFPVTGVVDERLLAELRVVDANIRADR